MIRRVAVFVTLLLGATVTAATPVAAAASTPDQVALVVDYPNGSTRSFCVDFRSGMSGADVLAVAGPSYGTGPYAGFVLKIGGQGTVPPTTSDYWAYWTTQNGSLVYSGKGVTATKPVAGSVEAWHWNSSGSQESPSGGAYTSLCPGGFAAAPSSAAPAPPASSVAAPTRAGGEAPTAAAPTSDRAGTPSPGVDGSATGTATTSATPGATGPTSAAATGSAATSAGSSPPASPASSVAASNVAAVDGTGGPGTGAVVGIVVAAVAVVGFVAATLVARRRRAERD